jgi:hypothetical protein
MKGNSIRIYDSIKISTIDKGFDPFAFPEFDQVTPQTNWYNTPYGSSAVDNNSPPQWVASTASNGTSFTTYVWQ